MTTSIFVILSFVMAFGLGMIVLLTHEAMTKGVTGPIHALFMFILYAFGSACILVSIGGVVKGFVT